MKRKNVYKDMTLYDIIKGNLNIEDYIDFGYNGTDIDSRMHHLVGRSYYNGVLNTINILVKSQTSDALSFTLLTISYTKNITLQALCDAFGWMLK